MKRRAFWVIVTATVIFALYITYANPSWLVFPSLKASAPAASVKSTPKTGAKSSTIAPAHATATVPLVAATPAETPAVPPSQSVTDSAQTSSTGSDKCYDTSQCLNPNRPSYDGWGNEFDYQGNLINAACPNVPDPISHQDNPYCVCPPATSEGAYYPQGNDKETGAIACGFEYYHACPYADAQPADGAVCQKLTAEAQASGNVAD